MLPPAPRNDPLDPPRVSVYIIAFNEAEKIRDAVSSVLWADEIVVADSHSTDGTVQIAESLGARVVQIEFNGFGDLRNRAIEACRGATGSWAGGSATRAGTRTSASRSSSATARCAITTIRSMKGTNS